ncbi:hypothetical protein [Paracoccus sp. KR1-242]|uniref:hypothetical protein n=1 Tax=Paracoccus sp. KR1-242 TaxID=3410028 RepID=UPI003C01A765
MALSIRREGPDPRVAVPDLLRAGVGEEVTAQQNRLTAEAVGLGLMSGDDLRRVLIVGSTTRTIPGGWNGINQWPLVPYRTITTDQQDNRALMVEAARYIVADFNRRAPRGTAKKNHPWRYAAAFRIYRGGREIPAIPPVEQITPEDAFQFIDVAPYASSVEIRHDVMTLVARDAIARFPTLSITFSWINSDQIGLRYGAGTGGPSSGSAIYALPLITLSMEGGSRVATRRRLRGRKRR